MEPLRPNTRRAKNAIALIWVMLCATIIITIFNLYEFGYEEERGLSNLTKLETLDFYLSELVVVNNSIKICNSVLEKADINKFNPRIEAASSSFQVVNCE